MSHAPWPQQPPPAQQVAPTAAWRGRPSTTAELSSLRGRLRAELLTGPLADGGAAEDVERLLLAFDELASNGLRHGRPPVRVAVTALRPGWLLMVSDTAAEHPPVPALGADTAHGGLGLHVVARISAGYGWIRLGSHKHVWARLLPVAQAAP